MHLIVDEAMREEKYGNPGCKEQHPTSQSVEKWQPHTLIMGSYLLQRTK